MGWTNPWVLAALIGGTVVLAIFCVIETRVAHPMFQLDLFRIRAFSAGNVASLLSGLGRGGLMFILIIWLQGIWLPRHGYSFESTPLWAGIFMLPMTVGFLIAGPSLGLPLRPVRCPPLRHRGHGRRRAELRVAAAPAGRLHLLAVRRRAPGQRPRHGPVRLTEPGGHHERPPAAPSWRRGRDEHDVPERGHGALDRDLLLPHGHRALGHASAGDGQWPHRPRCDPGAGAAGRWTAAGGSPVRLAAGLQPDPVPARPHRRSTTCRRATRPT